MHCSLLGHGFIRLMITASLIISHILLPFCQTGEGIEILRMRSRIGARDDIYIRQNDGSEVVEENSQYLIHFVLIRFGDVHEWAGTLR